jgi:hypothetical protein
LKGETFFSGKSFFAPRIPFVDDAKGFWQTISFLLVRTVEGKIDQRAKIKEAEASCRSTMRRKKSSSRRKLINFRLI